MCVLGVQDGQGVPGQHMMDARGYEERDEQPALLSHAGLHALDGLLGGEVLLDDPHGPSVLALTKPLGLNLYASVQLYSGWGGPVWSETGLELYLKVGVPGGYDVTVLASLSPR